MIQDICAYISESDPFLQFWYILKHFAQIKANYACYRSVDNYSSVVFQYWYRSMYTSVPDQQGTIAVSDMNIFGCVGGFSSLLSMQLAYDLYQLKNHV